MEGTQGNTATSMMEALLCELQCAVCLELFKHPIILPCSHILCRSPCAERLFDHGFVRCPICRENSFVSGGVQNLPLVKSLENIIEYYQSPPLRPNDQPQADNIQADACGEDDIACQLCDAPPKRAVKSCLNCSASYCSQCLKLSHPDREPFKEHQLVEPGKFVLKVQEVKCPKHDARVNVFCLDCQVLGCLLCADDLGIHQNHRIFSLEQAASLLRQNLEENILKLKSTQENFCRLTKSYHESLNDFQQSVRQRCSQINAQCDGLVSEVETKRGFFLSDLEYEEKDKVEVLNKAIAHCNDHCAVLQSLFHCTKEVLREPDQCSFIQLAKSINDRAKRCLSGVDEPATPLSPTAITLHHKVVDLRKERALLRDMSYLSLPTTPQIDVLKCLRSTCSIVLVLCPPSGDEQKVLDGYTVYYSSEDEQREGKQSQMIFKAPGEERNFGGRVISNPVCLIQSNLKCATAYRFSVRAFNAAGESELSDVVNCVTLSESQSTLPLPEITEGLCHAYTSSIQLYSPSPLGLASSSAGQDLVEPPISFYMLYREASANKIWKSVSLCARVDHRVFGLESDMLYDFVIMSCNKNGECQVSNMVTMKTERAAY